MARSSMPFQMTKGKKKTKESNFEAEPKVGAKRNMMGPKGKMPFKRGGMVKGKKGC